MLQELRIRDFVIVDSIEVQFQEGLNVVTGETGAGKSILVNALELLLGARGSQELIRPSSKEAVVEAVFTATEPLKADLRELDIPVEDEIIIRRVLSSTGRNRAYINDRTVTLQGLQQVSMGLMDLHGQHEHQSLLRTSSHRDLLDHYGGLMPQREKVERLFRQYTDLQKRLREAKETSMQRQQRIDLLQYQIREIREAGLKETEMEELLAERKILQNLTRLRQATEEALFLLKDRDSSVLNQLAEVISSVRQIVALDSEASAAEDLLREAEALLQEAGFSLRHLLDKYDLEPSRLDEVERRLQVIDKLRKKYGETISEILAFQTEAEKELQRLLRIDEETGDLEDSLRVLETDLTREVEILSRGRQEAAIKLQTEMKEVLRRLAFSHPEFVVQIKEAPLSSYGKDSVEFLFSANPGIPPRPLQKVASGGELSRVMLGLKSVLSAYDSVPIMVFDEVDAGIGGRTAEAVSEMLYQVSEKHQVICITHLPQIAAKARHHLVVEKKQDRDRVKVTLRVLSQKDRLREIARMLSGTVTETSLVHAKELLSGAQVKK